MIVLNVTARTRGANNRATRKPQPARNRAVQIWRLSAGCACQRLNEAALDPDGAAPHIASVHHTRRHCNERVSQRLVAPRNLPLGCAPSAPAWSLLRLSAPVGECSLRDDVLAQYVNHARVGQARRRPAVRGAFCPQQPAK